METPNTTSPKRPVLVTASVILAAPADDSELVHRLSAVAEQLHRAVEQAFAADPDCAPVGGAAFHYLDDGSENARRVEWCGQWTTDVNQPDPLDALQWGSVIDGRFLCEQCRVHLIEFGELPDPMTGRRRPR